MHRTRIALITLLSVLALLAAACGGDTAELAETGGTPIPDSTTGATDQATPTDPDVAFLVGMIPHHEQAVEMARLVPDRTDRPELNQLAEDIIAAQEAELVSMDQMLADHGAKRDAHATEGGHGGEGMQGEEEMARLADLDGTEFDLAFADMMIAHHEGAIADAELVLDAGQDPEVRQLAEQIVAAQRDEVDQLTTWREQWAPQSG